MISHRVFAAVAVLGMLVAGFFMVRSLRGDLVYYLTTTEAAENRSEFTGRAFKLSGLVVPGSIVDRGGGESDFQVTDGATTVDVSLTRTPPPLFDEDVPVLLSGSWEGDVFVADDALIRHDESYETPSEGNYPSGKASAAGSG